jgi:hypothetical protein
MFPGQPFQDLAFTWGSYIYTPLGKLPDDVIIHEGVHARQQFNSQFIGFFCILLYKWCRPYRRRCEVQAFRAQAKYLKQHGLPYKHLALTLGSPLYDVMTLEEAVVVIEP